MAAQNYMHSMTVRVYVTIALWDLVFSPIEYVVMNILVNTSLYVDIPFDKYLVVKIMN